MKDIHHVPRNSFTLIELLVHDAKLHADGNYGLLIVKILEAIRESSNTGKMVSMTIS